MKKTLYFCLGFLICMALIPTMTLMKNEIAKRRETDNTDISPDGVISDSPVTYDEFRLLDTSQDRIITVSDFDFCCGALAAEMPVSFDKEALKAQTVAIFTYYSKMRDESRSAGNDSDFEVNTEKNLIYIPNEKLKDMWGENYTDYYSKIEDCVNSVFGQALLYDDELILSCFCALNGGTTENSKDVFGGELPYLTAVASPGDCFAPEYLTERSFTTDEFEEIATGTWNGISLDGSPQQWVTDIERTDSGTVSQIVIGNAKTTGDEVRKAFALRSANFDIVYSQNEFVFTVRGYGHGVGMSQYGAQYMALQGADYKEILCTYYPNTAIAKVKENI